MYSLRLAPGGCLAPCPPPGGQQHPPKAIGGHLPPQRDGAAKSMALRLLHGGVSAPQALPISLCPGVQIFHMCFVLSRPGGWKSEIKVWAGPHSLCRLQRRSLPVPLPAPGVATVLELLWLAASLCPCLPEASPLCVPSSHKDTLTLGLAFSSTPLPRQRPYFKMTSSSKVPGGCQF